MPLNKAQLKAQLQTDLSSMFNDLSGGTAEEKAEEIATIISEAVDAYIRQALVSVQIPPLAVSQGVSPTVIANPAPIPLTGTLS